MIKLIATDLDGTLLYPKKKILLINKLNKKFLSKYTKDGNHLVLVSGRNIPIAKRMERKFQSRVDMIGCNGSIIYLNNEIIFEDGLDKEKIKNLYEENLLNENIGQWIFMTNHHNMIIVPNGMNTLIKVCYRIGMMFQFRYHGSFKFGKRFIKKEFAKEDTKIYKAMAIYGLGKKACKRARIAYDDFIQKNGNEFEIMWSNESVEFMNKGVNKATALNSIINKYQIEKNEVAVVGDSGNDLPMFESFENSFVMSHANDEIKQKANTIIDGVYDIEKYLDK